MAAALSSAKTIRCRVLHTNKHIARNMIIINNHVNRNCAEGCCGEGISKLHDFVGIVWGISGTGACSWHGDLNVRNKCFFSGNLQVVVESLGSLDNERWVTAYFERQ